MMYGAILVAVLVFIVMFILSLMDDGFYGMYFILSLLISLMGFVVVMMAGVLIAPMMAVNEEIVDTVEIFALQDNVGVADIRYVGSGLDKDNYYYITKEKHGKHMEKVDVTKSYINERSDIKLPTLEKVETKVSSKFFNWFFGETVINTKYIFNVPIGTLTTEFEVDLK